MQDYVAPRGLTVLTCAASGTKFHDLNANGRRDPGEPGLPRYVIWADYDDDGVREAVEPFALTDSEGQYVINDIRPPDGTYTLRETLLTMKARRRAASGDVTCSFPNNGTPGGTGSAPGGMFQCGWDRSARRPRRGRAVRISAITSRSGLLLLHHLRRLLHHRHRHRLLPTATSSATSTTTSASTSPRLHLHHRRHLPHRHPSAPTSAASTSSSTTARTTACAAFADHPARAEAARCR